MSLELHVPLLGSSRSGNGAPPSQNQETASPLAKALLANTPLPVDVISIIASSLDHRTISIGNWNATRATAIPIAKQQAVSKAKMKARITAIVLLAGAILLVALPIPGFPFIASIILSILLIMCSRITGFMMPSELEKSRGTDRPGYSSTPPHVRLLFYTPPSPEVIDQIARGIIEEDVRRNSFDSYSIGDDGEHVYLH